MTPIQRILFGSPGTGKSHRVVNDIIPIQLSIDKELQKNNVVKTVFHPEYTYGDFMGKLLPSEDGKAVMYRFYPGVFLRALAKAYRAIIRAKFGQDKPQDQYLPDNICLVIDEINRGNSSAIFGTVFQLLDRDSDGWSSYEVTLSEMEFATLTKLIVDDKTEKFEVFNERRVKIEINENNIANYWSAINVDSHERKVRIPHNLSIIATMNTSDSSIYYMDSAFKRRWEWEYVSVDDSFVPPKDEIVFTNWKNDWKPFVNKLNDFLKDKHEHIRGIEDKLIGYWFIKGDNISKQVIQSKLMFFIWDSVFSRDKTPLINLLGVVDKKKLVTFGDFTSQYTDLFIKQIKEYKRV